MASEQTGDSPVLETEKRGEHCHKSNLLSMKGTSPNPKRVDITKKIYVLK